MNSSALNSACIDIWKKASIGIFIDRVTVISPSWLRVERAIIFISFSKMAIILAMVIVGRPNNSNLICNIVFSLMILLKRYIIKIPAVTSVDECTSADTRVGEAIAAGSQQEYGN